MTQQYNALGESTWREPRRPLPILALLVVGTGLWLLLYTALGWRLWQNGAMRIDGISLALLAATIALGVAVVLAWRMAWPELRRSREIAGGAHCRWRRCMTSRRPSSRSMWPSAILPGRVLP